MSSNFYKQSTLPGISSEEEKIKLPGAVGPYKIESLLNKGGMSILYLGLHPETKKPLAIKVLLPQFVNHSEMINRFMKEAQIIEVTTHPNIVKLYGHGEWEGGLYIAMELIQGISLKQFILQHSLSLKRSLEIILQVAYALLHLHTHGIIHRDLKPENILITEDGEIKVIDFGISQMHVDKIPLKSSEFLGTPDYMSPEQKEDPNKVNYSSDIYSLGIIAYELITGRLSFGLVNLASLPEALRKIIGKALALTVSERYQDIVDFITDISGYLKSAEHQKEKPESDLLKEFLENLQAAQVSLSPATTPDWPYIDIALSKFKMPEQFGLYYDFFPWPNESFVLVMAQSLSVNVDSAVYSAILRGMVKMYVQEELKNTKEPFRPLPFVTALNQMLVKDHFSTPTALSVLILSPWKDQLSFISCGLGSLIRFETGSSSSHLLNTNNPPLGKSSLTEFLETTDNWTIGDTLIIHSLEKMDTELTKAAKDNMLISSKRLPDAMLKQISSSSSFTLNPYPKLILSIKRTA